jgi:diketogulonate reductase-like aldo/keto reductase
MYNTESEMGAAIQESVAEGVVKREDLFITTKISRNFTEVQTAIDISLQKLRLDYVDLYVSVISLKPVSLSLLG